MHNRSHGRCRCRSSIRIPFGGGIGAVEHHSESPGGATSRTRRAEGGGLLQRGRRLLDDPAGHRLRRPGDLLRAQAPLLARRASSTPAVDADRRCTARGSSRPGTRRDARRLRPDGARPAWMPPARPPRRARARGDRPALALADRHGAPSSTRCARPARWSWSHEAPAQRRRRRRDRRPDHRAVLLLAGGAGAAGRRLRHALPAVAGRGAVPARPRPGARRRRPVAGVLSPTVANDEARVSDQEFRLPDVGEGLTEAEIVTWKVDVGDTVGQPDPRRDRDRRSRWSSCRRRSRAWSRELLVAEGDDRRRRRADHHRSRTAGGAGRRACRGSARPDRRGQRNAVANLVGYGARRPTPVGVRARGRPPRRRLTRRTSRSTAPSPPRPGARPADHREPLQPAPAQSHGRSVARAGSGCRRDRASAVRRRAGQASRPQARP